MSGTEAGGWLREIPSSVPTTGAKITIARGSSRLASVEASSSRQGEIGNATNRESSLWSSTPAERIGQVTQTAAVTKQSRFKMNVCHTPYSAIAGSRISA